MSPSFPHKGVDTVEANRYDTTTHDRWLAPCNSPTIVGKAVETTVWSRADKNIPNMRADKIAYSCLFGTVVITLSTDEAVSLWAFSSVTAWRPQTFFHSIFVEPPLPRRPASP